MKCPNCGETSRIRKKDKFCHKCGRNLKVSTINEMRIPRMKNGADIAMKLKEPVNSNFLLNGKDIFCAVQNEQSSDQQIKNDSEESNISNRRW